MVTAEDLAGMMLDEGWRLLPACKWRAPITDVVFTDLGERHGAYDPARQVITLNLRLFLPPVQALPTYDVEGNAPAATTPWVYRGLATWLHEVAHALGHGTGWDADPAWLALSGWTYQPLEVLEVDPAPACRYREQRVGWEYDVSPWRHARPCWFARDYSRKSPQEDFADCVTHVVLGWTAYFGDPRGGDPALGRQKLRYVQERLYDLDAAATFAAGLAAWRRRMRLRVQGE